MQKKTKQGSKNKYKYFCNKPGSLTDLHSGHVESAGSYVSDHQN